jgi:hypothetical protein
MSRSVDLTPGFAFWTIESEDDEFHEWTREV